MYSINLKMNNIWRLFCYTEYTFKNSIEVPFDKLGDRHVEGINGFMN